MKQFNVALSGVGLLRKQKALVDYQDIVASRNSRGKTYKSDQYHCSLHTKEGLLCTSDNC